MYKNKIGKTDIVVRCVCQIIIIITGRLDSRESRIIKAQHTRSREDSLSVYLKLIRVRGCGWKYRGDFQGRTDHFK